MSLEIQNKKIELIQWLTSLEDVSVIEKILSLRKEQKQDWWDKISAAEKASIEKGIEEANAGNLKPNSEAKKLYYC